MPTPKEFEQRESYQKRHIYCKESAIKIAFFRIMR